MKYKVDNAIIMAAGTSSRFAPLSFEIPKALITVKGEVLIERQIKQLQQAGIKDIYIVVGYKAEMFEYLAEKFGVTLLNNRDYLERNNNASIYAAKDVIKNTYICSADNYFSENPFNSEEKESYYSAVYAYGPTKEWCISYASDNRITDVVIGGENEWFMLGHAFWDEIFSKRFLTILEDEYNLETTRNLLWEHIYINHINEFDMKIKKFADDVIFEFDTLDELREFDESYIYDTRSEILKSIACELNCEEKDIRNVMAFKGENNAADGFEFTVDDIAYSYSYSDRVIRN